jgi:hypothetical protein
MKYSFCLAALALSANEVIAFPSRMFDLSFSEEEKRNIAGIAATIELEGKERRQLIQPTFDASTQYVSTTGQYAYVAPTSSDLRGPCPGLNAMANHGYSVYSPPHLFIFQVVLGAARYVLPPQTCTRLLSRLDIPQTLHKRSNTNSELSRSPT